LSDDERDTLMRERISTLMSSIPVASGRSLEISTQAYRTMGSAYPEAFEDANNNGVYDEELLRIGS
jgi:hemoglobin-like flavoprotein